MAKRKKASASPSYNRKKSIATPDKKSEKKIQPKLNSKKVQPKINIKKIEIITEKIHKINQNFECLIQDCKNALIKLTENKSAIIH